MINTHPLGKITNTFFLEIHNLDRNLEFYYSINRSDSYRIYKYALSLLEHMETTSYRMFDSLEFYSLFLMKSSEESDDFPDIEFSSVKEIEDYLHQKLRDSLCNTKRSVKNLHEDLMKICLQIENKEVVVFILRDSF